MGGERGIFAAGRAGRKIHISTLISLAFPRVYYAKMVLFYLLPDMANHTIEASCWQGLPGGHVAICAVDL